MENYFLTLLAVFGIAANFMTNKVAQQVTKAYDNTEIALRMSVPTGLISALLFFAMSGFSIRFTLFSFLMALLLAVVNVLSVAVCFKAYEKGNVALFTVFRMQGGMLLPFLYGAVFADNEINVPRIVGIALMVLSLFIPYIGNKKDGTPAAVSPLYAILCVCVFFLNGTISIVSYIHSNSALSAGDYSFLTFLNLLVAAASAAAYAVFCRTHPGNIPATKPHRDKRELTVLWAMIVLGSVFGGLSYWLQLVGAAHLPAVALYPLVTGGTVVVTALAGRFFLKEKMTARAYAGVILTALATFLFVF